MKIVGWMENVREVGANFAFVVVRDFYGTTQVVIETAEMLQIVKSVNKESTIAVTGTVRERASKNPKLATGEIEVVPEKIEILGRCRHNELPFEVNRSRDADEMVRLKYRYLDLRNPAVKNNIVLRCNVVAALRRFMKKSGVCQMQASVREIRAADGAVRTGFCRNSRCGDLRYGDPARGKKLYRRNGGKAQGALPGG